MPGRPGLGEQPGLGPAAADQHRVEACRAPPRPGPRRRARDSWVGTRDTYRRPVRSVTVAGRSRRSERTGQARVPAEHGSSQHHQARDVVAGQGQHPVARAAEPRVGRLDRGADRGAGQHRGLGPAGGPGGGDHDGGVRLGHRLVGTEHSQGPPSFDRGGRQRGHHRSAVQRGHQGAGDIGRTDGAQRSEPAPLTGPRLFGGRPEGQLRCGRMCAGVDRAADVRDRGADTFRGLVATAGHGLARAPPAGPSGARSWTTRVPSW